MRCTLNGENWRSLDNDQIIKNYVCSRDDAENLVGDGICAIWAYSARAATHMGLLCMAACGIGRHPKTGTPPLLQRGARP